jgi:hypothetical protein
MRRTVYQLATRAPGSRLKANQISDFRNFVSASFAPLELLEAPRLPRGFGLKRLAEPKDAMSAFGKMSSDLRRRGLGNHVDLRGLLGGAEGIRTDGHRGRGEISSWIAAWGFAGPLKAALGGGLPFRLAASRYRGRGKKTCLAGRTKAMIDVDQVVIGIGEEGASFVCACRLAPPDRITR